MRYQIALGGITLRVEVVRGPGGLPQGYSEGRHASGSRNVTEPLAAVSRRRRRGQTVASAERQQAHLEHERMAAAARSSTDYWARTLLMDAHHRNWR